MPQKNLKGENLMRKIQLGVVFTFALLFTFASLTPMITNADEPAKKAPAKPATASKAPAATTKGQAGGTAKGSGAAAKGAAASKGGASLAVLKAGKAVFEDNCIACHDGGNNTIEAAKTLKLDALKKFGFNSTEDIKKRVQDGAGVMPAFKEQLKPAQIDAVAAYVWSQAQKGWK
jgi:cytochrome c6